MITAIADSVFGIWPKDEERAREESLGISGRQVEEEGWRDCFLFFPFRVRMFASAFLSKGCFMAFLWAFLSDIIHDIETVFLFLFFFPLNLILLK